MLLKKATEREWIDAGANGVQRSLFRNNPEGGRSSVLRMTAGARVPRHTHHGTEEVLVLEGRVTLDGVELSAGDYLFVESGEEHDVIALTDALLFISTQKSTAFVE